MLTSNRYLEKLHPCFPIVDVARLALQNEGEDTNHSSTTILDIYATTICYWHHLPSSIRQPRPDSRFAWNLAVKALQEDFLAPRLSTLQAALVDLIGRPIFSLKGNVINTGRCVALANSLGLNRDPKGWNIGAEEKSLRVRLWWGVLIHDSWFVRK